MPIELITGVGETNHISSNDFRAFNRGVFGQGKYILNDGDNMYVSLSASTGTISILSGSCVWSGMHIRVKSATELNYIVPTAAQEIYVYLHYTKESTTEIEKVEFIVSTTQLSPIIDNLSDSTIEAYTLFYSFTASSAQITNPVCHFTMVNPNEILSEKMQMMQDSKVLFSGSAEVGSYINLSEEYKNFFELQFISDTGDVARLLTMNISVGGLIPVPMFGIGMFSNTGGVYLDVDIAAVEVKDETQLLYKQGFNFYIASSVATAEKPKIVKVIGIGRVI